MWIVKFKTWFGSSDDAACWSVEKNEWLGENLPWVGQLRWALTRSSWNRHSFFPVGPFVLVVPLAFMVLHELLVLGYIIESDGGHDDELLLVDGVANLLATMLEGTWEFQNKNWKLRRKRERVYRVGSDAMI